MAAPLSTESIHPRFQYLHLGSLAYVGGDEAIADWTGAKTVISFTPFLSFELTPLKIGKLVQPMSGVGTYWLWRSVYFSELFTHRARAQLVFASCMIC